MRKFGKLTALRQKCEKQGIVTVDDDQIVQWCDDQDREQEQEAFKFLMEAHDWPYMLYQQNHTKNDRQLIIIFLPGFYDFMINRDGSQK